MEMRNPPALQLVSIYMCIVFINEVDSPNGGLYNQWENKKSPSANPRD